jgi:hypothetical protein
MIENRKFPSHNYHPLCPYCGEMLIDLGDKHTYTAVETVYGYESIWMMWCGFCHKLLSAAPIRKRLIRRL